MDVGRYSTFFASKVCIKISVGQAIIFVGLKTASSFRQLRIVAQYLPNLPNTLVVLVLS